MPSFVLMFFCLKTSKHPLNTTSARDTSSLARIRDLNFTNAGCNNKKDLCSYITK